ncbi:OprO/OprP family phosphate-selective porin [Ereboglobus luteus]|uniref:Porin n=1 Tax=Ereboglobus luteus TaxID=1796921 RepID=A0A2U8E6K7_9BACT|nr:porin [Ereboglobus luteus]AWI10162.1 hypothetical protein CKA38_13645 [Ereboglobus luteus]
MITSLRKQSIFGMSCALVLAFFAVAVFGPSQAFADSRDEEIKQLRAMINALDQKLQVLEREQALRKGETAVTQQVAAQPAAASQAAPAQPSAESTAKAKVIVDDKGFTLASADDSNRLRLRGLMQADSRWYGDGGAKGRDSFVLRRARVMLEGQFSNIFRFQFVPEYGGSSFTLMDANVAIDFAPSAQLKIGKFKAPFGLARLQSDAWAALTEPSFIAQIAPSRDIGVQLGGSFFGGALDYQVGVFNGVGDGRSNQDNTDSDDDKDVYARIFAHPFKSLKDSPLAGLGIGIAGSHGRQNTRQGLTAGYRTSGQQTLFTYASDNGAGNYDTSLPTHTGEIWRISPQAYYYYGPFGLLAEYVTSTTHVRPNAGQDAMRITNKAWQVTSGWVLTGENASYDGVTPARPFSVERGTWGAFELVARYDHIDVDNDVFPILANPAESATEAASWGVGLNWYLTRAVRFSVDYNQTDPKDSGLAAPTGTVLKKGEKVILTRAQITF